MTSLKVFCYLQIPGYKHTYTIRIMCSVNTKLLNSHCSLIEIGMPGNMTYLK